MKGKKEDILLCCMQIVFIISIGIVAVSLFIDGVTNCIEFLNVEDVNENKITENNDSASLEEYTNKSTLVYTVRRDISVSWKEGVLVFDRTKVTTLTDD